MKNIIQEIKDCSPESIISKLEVAVAKMETTTSTCKDSLQVGNIAAMYDALKKARDLILPQCNGGTAFAKACGAIVNEIIAALSAPPRNCDVGTAEEQADRFNKFCGKQGGKCEIEPIYFHQMKRLTKF